MSSIIRCEICGKELKYSGTGAHIKSHNISVQEYYDRFLKKDKSEGICPVCGNPTRFLGFNGYRKYCSDKCSSNSKEVKDKIKATCLERYGVSNTLQAKEVREKIEQTCLEKYGVPTVCQADEIIQKIKENNIKKYGVSCTLCTEENIEKKKKTWKEKYGVDWVSQAEEVKEVNRQTCLEKYGVEYYLQTSEKKEKSRQTCLERYGVEHPAQTMEVQEKISHTCLERYGVEYYWQSDELKTILQEKKDEIVKKIHDTKKKNGTFGKSALEDKIFEQLKLIYEKVERQYREERYPFNCDFYIPEYDLFIELNGFCTHNDHWYDESSENDRKIVEDLKTKNTGFCNAILDTWTRGDVVKRNMAKENNLNYVVFWDENDFNIWLEEGHPVRKDWK